MTISHESLARVQVSARLDEAQRLRRGRQLARLTRVNRRAERLAHQARLALARTL